MEDRQLKQDKRREKSKKSHACLVVMLAVFIGTLCSCLIMRSICPFEGTILRRSQPSMECILENEFEENCDAIVDSAGEVEDVSFDLFDFYHEYLESGVPANARTLSLGEMRCENEEWKFAMEGKWKYYLLRKSNSIKESTEEVGYIYCQFIEGQLRLDLEPIMLRDESGNTDQLREDCAEISSFSSTHYDKWTHYVGYAFNTPVNLYAKSFYETDSHMYWIGSGIYSDNTSIELVMFR
jgi:hypothetical protein